MLLTAPKKLGYSSSCCAPPHGRLVSVPEDFWMNDGSHRHSYLQPLEWANSGLHWAVWDVSPVFWTVGAQGSIHRDAATTLCRRDRIEAVTLPLLPPATAHKPMSSNNHARRDQLVDWSILTMLCPLIWSISKIRTFGSLISCPTLLLFMWQDVSMAL